MRTIIRRRILVSAWRAESDRSRLIRAAAIRNRRRGTPTARGEEIGGEEIGRVTGRAIDAGWLRFHDDPRSSVFHFRARLRRSGSGFLPICPALLSIHTVSFRDPFPGGVVVVVVDLPEADRADGLDRRHELYVSKTNPLNLSTLRLINNRRILIADLRRGIV